MICQRPNPKLFCGFSEDRAEYVEQCQLAATEELQARGSVTEEEKLIKFQHFKTDLLTSEPPEARTASPIASLSKGEICQNTVVSFSPTSRS